MFYKQLLELSGSFPLNDKTVVKLEQWGHFFVQNFKLKGAKKKRRPLKDNFSINIKSINVFHWWMFTMENLQN